MQARPVAAPAELQPDGWEIFAYLGVAVLLVDRAGRVARANIAAEELFGASEAALSVRKLPDELKRLLEHEGGARAHDVRLPLFGGERRADVFVAPLGSRPGWLTVAIATGTEDIGRAGSQQAAATIAAILAHEIKNPLAGIRGAAQLIGKGELGDPRELTDLIKVEVDRIVRLVERFEGLSEERTTFLAPINLNEPMRHVSALAAGFSAGVTIREQFDPSLPMIAGDRDSLAQLFINLVKNAVEATEGLGEITLVTAYRHGLRREGRLLPIEARVIDTGPGVPARVVPRLFEPFVSSKKAGRGLGLALAAKIAADHGGAIDYVRDRGRTVFRVLFPVG